MNPGACEQRSRRVFSCYVGFMSFRWQQWPRRAERPETCARKRRYATWEAARLAGLAVWRESPLERHANPPDPYPCYMQGEPHYHCGH